ncbi:uncharacterized protein TA17560 [Theileria annulata]|uniref:Uncharacterized protein n=1 Tax=Theileria annulata TaxID=5874 RepID=Q4UD57_THEAN|nr:uncharacterized protein TA17560 [Theileria annulata]CAI75244.1 hypothetical protein TA17560 [Theileria annulata]|eukprot:XP_954720.1 hypothetical protein TA17560 [Theileria annulata]
MGKVSIIASLVVGFVAISIICLSVGLIYRNKKAKVDTPATEIIWSFHLENDSDLKLKGNLDVIDINILKTEDYSVGAYNANVNSIEHEFPTAKLTGWTHTYQEPLMIQKFVVESNEVNFLKVEPISGFTVFNNQDTGDFDDSNCSQLKYKENILWSVQGNRLPAKSVYINLSIKSLMIETGDSLLVFMHFDNWKLILKSGDETDPVYTPEAYTSDEPQLHLRYHTSTKTYEQSKEYSESKS